MVQVQELEVEILMVECWKVNEMMAELMWSEFREGGLDDRLLSSTGRLAVFTRYDAAESLDLWCRGMHRAAIARHAQPNRQYAAQVAYHYTNKDGRDHPTNPPLCLLISARKL